MDVVHGVDSLRAEHGRLFIVVGVFDGLHLGHRYLLDHLVREATARSARPTVITFDHHPDEILTGAAPPLLMDPAERIERLAAAGVEVAVVQHFDAALRATRYDTFVARVRARTALAGFLMTPDAAFGFERRGTPARLAELGRERGFEVSVVPPFDLDGEPVSSSTIRAAITAGDLGTARRLLGRDISLRATVTGVDADDVATLGFPLPVALPPDGAYPCAVGDDPVTLTVRSGSTTLTPAPSEAQVTITIVPPGGAAGSARSAAGVHHRDKPATIRRS